MSTTARRLRRSGAILSLVGMSGSACSSNGTALLDDSGTPSSSLDGSSSSGGSSGGSSSGVGGSSSSGSGGSNEAGAADAGITILFPFDMATSSNDVAAWPGDNFCISQTGIDAGAGPSDAGSAADGQVGTLDAAPNPCGIYNYLQGISSVAYDPNVGDPGLGGDPGSLEITVPFSQFSSQADFQYIFAKAVDLSNRTLFARVERDPGFNTLDTSNPEAFVLAVKTGTTFAYGASTYANFTAPAGQFQEFDLSLLTTPVGAAAGFDPTNVVAIELHFDTGAGPDPADAGALQPTTTTFHVDTIGYR